MMGWSSRCYIPSFVEIGSPVPKKIFEGFLPYMGVAATFGNVTSIMYSNSYFLVPNLKAFLQNLVQVSTVVSEKIQF